MESIFPFEAFLNQSHQFRLQYYTNSSLISATSEETSSGASQHVKEERVELRPWKMFTPLKRVGLVKFKELKKNLRWMTKCNHLSFCISSTERSISKESLYSVLLLGDGSLVALWLATAVVGAIDSIPVISELMKVVGLAYSLWFSTRYLLFQKNRDELSAKIEEIKQQVLGSNDD